MRKLSLFYALALSFLTATAQQPYNGSFETWYTRLQPDGWGTWASVYASYNTAAADSLIRLASRDSITHAAYPHDTLCVRLLVDTITLPAQGQVTLAGFISYGGASYVAPPDTSAGLHFGYYPYAKKPDSLIFDYKYVPVAGFNDSPLVVMTMNRFDSISQREVYYISQSWLLSPVDSWSHISLPLTYAVSDTFQPDSIQLYIIGSVARYPHIGSSLWLDSIHFDASVNIIIDTFPAGITDLGHLRHIRVHPDPADQIIHIRLPEAEVGSSIRLYAADGRCVYTAWVERQQLDISTVALPAGSYTLRLCSSDHITTYTAHIAIVHSVR